MVKRSFMFVYDTTAWMYSWKHAWKHAWYSWGTVERSHGKALSSVPHESSIPSTCGNGLSRLIDDQWSMLCVKAHSRAHAGMDSPDWSMIDDRCGNEPRQSGPGLPACTCPPDHAWRVQWTYHSQHETYLLHLILVQFLKICSLWDYFFISNYQYHYGCRQSFGLWHPAAHAR